MEPFNRVRWLPTLHAMTLAAALALAGPARAEDPVPSEVPEPSPASAEMLKSMREKGILSQEEYEDLYRRQAVYEYEERERDKAPPWFRDWVVGGDVRVRFERIDQGDLKLSRVITDGITSDDDQLERGEDNVDFLNLKGVGIRDRMRLRFRIGAERRLGENWRIGFRIATAQQTTLTADYGEDVTGVDLSKQVVDFRSANVDLSGYFEPKGIYLDRAYIEFNPEIAPALRIVAGKFENPFRSKYLPYDGLVWDEDIQPEGVAIRYRFDFLPETWWTELNFGYLMVEEVGAVDLTLTSPTTATTTLPDNDDRDAYLLAYQAATYAEPVDWLLLGLRGSYYDYHNLSIRDVFILSDLGNGGDAIEQNPALSELDFLDPYFQRGRSAGRLQQGVVDALFTVTPFGEKWPITPFVQYTTLLSATTETDGWGFGIEIGTTDVLEFRAVYAQLGRNSTVALFTDSDFFDGHTNAKGWYLSLGRKLSDNVTLRVSYYSSQQQQRACAAFAKFGASGNPALFCDAATAEALSTAADFRRTSTEHRKRIQIDLTAEF